MNKKLLLITIPVISALILVAGLSYYESIKFNIHIYQPIVISGAGEQDVYCDAGSICYGSPIIVNNTGNKTIQIEAINEDVDGVSVTYWDAKIEQFQESYKCSINDSCYVPEFDVDSNLIIDFWDFMHFPEHHQLFVGSPYDLEGNSSLVIYPMFEVDKYASGDKVVNIEII